MRLGHFSDASGLLLVVQTAIFIRAYTLKSVTVKAPNPAANANAEDKEKGIALVTSSDTRGTADTYVDVEGSKVPDTPKVAESGAEGSERRV